MIDWKHESQLTDGEADFWKEAIDTLIEMIVEEEALAVTHRQRNIYRRLMKERLEVLRTKTIFYRHGTFTPHISRVEDIPF